MAYSDIDSGKVLNKEGLLELSGQIKGYINTNMPQSYTLPTASTSTLGGVKVDGETITIADGVISATSSGGSSYTAGVGIEIDENNVITNQSMATNDYVLNIDGNTYSGINAMSYETDANAFIQQLRNGTKLFGKIKFAGTDLKSAIAAKYTHGVIYRINDNGTFTYYSSFRTYNATSDLATGVFYYILQEWQDRCSLFISTSLLGMRRFLGRYLAYSNSSIQATNIAGAIDEVNTNLNNRVPAAPTTDGTYMLKCVVSSGTPTYSWESVNVGGSY